MDQTGNSKTINGRRTTEPFRWLRNGICILCMTALLTSCATTSGDQQAATEYARTVDTTVYPYPLTGQSTVQQDRDYYECSLWAVEQSGFDPELQRLASEQRVKVVPATPPGTDAAGGAAAGAIVGSILAGPHHHGEGLVIGLITGLFFGLASDQAKREHVKQLQVQLNEQEWLRVEQLASQYRRAMTACLEGRGYEVR